jgi:GNAT superfamily N-acetyltransferase
MGKVFVDDPEQPTVFKLQTGPFCYFAGDPSGGAGQALIAALSPYSLLMPSTPGWEEAIRAVHTEKLHEFDRYSFSSERLEPAHLSRLCAASPWNGEIRPMDQAFAAEIWGKDHFIDLSDYDSPEDFAQRGIGFYVQKGERVTGAASAPLVCSRGIEVSIFIEEKYRRQGMATALASHLLLASLERSLAPHWDAANPESCKLALKLGYKPAGQYTAFYLVE